jgi:hypothetical protein
MSPADPIAAPSSPPWPWTHPPARRAALRRAVTVLAVLVALLLPWPGLGRAYVGAFSRTGSAAVGLVFDGSGLRVSLGQFPESDAHHEWYAKILVADARTGAPRHMGAADLRRSGYLQIATFLALAAAFPLPRRRRYAAAVGCGAAVLATLGWLPVLMYLSSKQVIVLGTGSFAVLSILDRSLVAAPGMAFALPVAQWLLARRLLGGREVASHPPETTRSSAASSIPR